MLLAPTKTALRPGVLPALLLIAVTSSGVSNPSCLAQDAPKKSREGTQCDTIYQRIVSIYRRLPEDFSAVSKARAAQIGAEVERASRDCARFLKACSDHPQAPEMHYYHAKYLHLLSRRFEIAQRSAMQAGGARLTPEKVEQLRNIMSGYYGRIAAHARAAFEKLDEGSDLRPEALYTCGRGQYEAGDFAGARATLEKFIDLYPDHSSFPATVSTLARTYLNLGEYDLGIALVEEHRKKESVYDSRNFAYLGEQLWKLYEAKGDLMGMLRTARAHRTLYELRLKSQSLDTQLREDIQRNLMFNGFRVGYALFGLGDLMASAAAFEQHVQELNAIEAELRARERSLPPYANIYRKRSLDCLRFIDELANRPAPRDFHLEGLWVTPREITLQSVAGKTLAVVFRNVGDVRSAPFLEEISAHCASEPGLEALTISFLKGAASAAAQMAELRSELSALGFEGAAGFDPDDKNKSLFRAYHANVGSATFLVIDRRGMLTWFQQDPRAVDVNLAKAILKRVHNES